MVTNGDFLGNSGQKKAEKYYCKNCDYSTSHESKWERHLKTKKHNGTQMVTNGDFLGNSGQKKAETKWTCACGKQYKYKQGYYRHKASCTYTEKAEVTELATQENKLDMQNMIGYVKELVDKNVQLVENNNKLTEKLVSLSSSQGHSINGDSNNIVQNNFNIQLFLNENCANALSIQDFAKQLKLTMDDVSLMKKDEPKAITNIIVKNLNDYTESERPFHHHKKKWYVKDKQEGWDNEGKENGAELVKTVKTGVSQKAGATFVENNPDWSMNQKKSEDYVEITSVAMKQPTEKIASKILNSVKQDVNVGD